MRIEGQLDSTYYILSPEPRALARAVSSTPLPLRQVLAEDTLDRFRLLCSVRVPTPRKTAQAKACGSGGPSKSRRATGSPAFTIPLPLFCHSFDIEWQWQVNDLPY